MMATKRGPKDRFGSEEHAEKIDFIWKVFKSVEISKYVGVSAATVSAWIHRRALPSPKFHSRIDKLFEVAKELYEEQEIVIRTRDNKRVTIKADD